jgi:hypothetical protein
MQKISLRFPSILQLIDFILAIDSNFCQLNKETLVLSGELLEKEIELAKSNYKAIVI